MTISEPVATTFRYEGNGVTDTFSYDARVFSASDLVVEIITRATDALEDTLVLTTDYSVTIADDGTASIVVTTAPTASQDIQIRRVISKAQTTELPTGSSLPAKVIESALDKIIAITQDIQQTIDRAATLPTNASATSCVLPIPQDGYGIVWDGTDGAFRNTTASLADLESGGTAVGEISAEVVIVAGIAADVEAVAANSSNITSVASNSTNINSVVSNSANINSVASNSSNINTVAGISGNVTTVATNSANVTTVAGISSNISTVAGISANITSVASNSTNINSVASNSANINSVASNSTNINSVASNSTNINTVAGISANISTVAGISADVTAAANNIPKANRVATTNPTANDDSGDGYSVGSMWINTSTDAIFFCADAALGAAVWQSNAGAMSGLSDVSVASLANNDFLVYNGTDWANETPSAARTSLGLGSSAVYSPEEIGAFHRPLGNKIAPHKNLVIYRSSVTQVVVSADNVIMVNASNQPKIFTTISGTISITTSGALGLDTGSEASSTWYYIWAIGKADDTDSVILSTSSSAPTLPSGYTYYGLLGAVYNNSSSDLVNFKQVGNKVMCPIQSPLSAGTATTYTSVSLAAYVPPIATSVDILIGSNSSSGSATTTTFVAPAGSGTTPTYGYYVERQIASTTSATYSNANILLDTAQTLYYYVSGANARGYIDLNGWSY